MEEKEITIQELSLETEIEKNIIEGETIGEDRLKLLLNAVTTSIRKEKLEGQR